MMQYALPYKTGVAEEYGERIAPLIKKLVINQREIEELIKLQDLLLPMLMNGQITVQS